MQSSELSALTDRKRYVFHLNTVTACDSNSVNSSDNVRSCERDLGSVAAGFANRLDRLVYTVGSANDVIGAAAGTNNPVSNVIHGLRSLGPPGLGGVRSKTDHYVEHVVAANTTIATGNVTNSLSRGGTTGFRRSNDVFTNTINIGTGATTQYCNFAYSVSRSGPPVASSSGHPSRSVYTTCSSRSGS